MSKSASSPLLMLAALGVVFGDIGTSPLYAFREAFLAAGLTASHLNVLGILSLITWTLLLVVTFKYVTVVMKADNHGEGGIFALTALALQQVERGPSRKIFLTVGLAGAALFFGDAVITPAISVLGALEGLSVKNPSLEPLILPLTLVILISLFAVQRHGTARVGSVFGVVMLVWFAALAALGLPHILQNPQVLHAFNPFYAIQFVAAAPLTAGITMGAVVLAVTGAEALYADMGHFGPKPIRRLWLIFVGPALLLNYYGQGAMVLADPHDLINPFYRLAPEPLVLPLVLLALLAAVVAAQAVISGAFSLTQQAIQLGYLPRMHIIHTNQTREGQIYIPAVNWLLCICVVLVVVSFTSSSKLAAAYGIAVTGTMLATTLLAMCVLRLRNHWSLLAVGCFTAFFVALDITFLAANTIKFVHGGWLPIVLGGSVLFVMVTWFSGRKMAHDLVYNACPRLSDFMEEVAEHCKTVGRPARTAVYLTSDLDRAPPALMYNMTHNNVLHKQVIILKVSRSRVPRVSPAHRVIYHGHTHGVATLEAHYGFMETPDVPKIIQAATRLKHVDPLVLAYPQQMSYFMAHHTYLSSDHPALNRFQEPLFRALDALSLNASSFFGIPKHQVIEIGNQIEV